MNRIFNPRSFAAASRAARTGPFRNQFHASARAFVKVGDAIPSVELMEGSPGNKVNIADALKDAKKAVIIGVPAAYSRLKNAE